MSKYQLLVPELVSGYRIEELEQVSELQVRLLVALDGATSVQSLATLLGLSAEAVYAELQVFEGQGIIFFGSMEEKRANASRAPVSHGPQRRRTGTTRAPQGRRDSRPRRAPNHPSSTPQVRRRPPTQGERRSPSQASRSSVEPVISRKTDRAISRREQNAQRIAALKRKKAEREIEAVPTNRRSQSRRPDTPSRASSSVGERRGRDIGNIPRRQTAIPPTRSPEIARASSREGISAKHSKHDSQLGYEQARDNNASVVVGLHTPRHNPSLSVLQERRDRMPQRDSGIRPMPTSTLRYRGQNSEGATQHSKTNAANISLGGPTQRMPPWSNSPNPLQQDHGPEAPGSSPSNESYEKVHRSEASLDNAPEMQRFVQELEALASPVPGVRGQGPLSPMPVPQGPSDPFGTTGEYEPLGKIGRAEALDSIVAPDLSPLPGTLGGPELFSSLEDVEEALASSTTPSSTSGQARKGTGSPTQENLRVSAGDRSAQAGHPAGHEHLHPSERTPSGRNPVLRATYSASGIAIRATEPPSVVLSNAAKPPSNTPQHQSSSIGPKAKSSEDFVPRELTLNEVRAVSFVAQGTNVSSSPQATPSRQGAEESVRSLPSASLLPPGREAVKIFPGSAPASYVRPADEEPPATVPRAEIPREETPYDESLNGHAFQTPVDHQEKRLMGAIRAERRLQKATEKDASPELQHLLQELADQPLHPSSRIAAEEVELSMQQTKTEE